MLSRPLPPYWDWGRSSAFPKRTRPNTPEEAPCAWLCGACSVALLPRLPPSPFEHQSCFCLSFPLLLLPSQTHISSPQGWSRLKSQAAAAGDAALPYSRRPLPVERFPRKAKSFPRARWRQSGRDARGLRVLQTSRRRQLACEGEAACGAKAPGRPLGLGGN